MERTFCFACGVEVRGAGEGPVPTCPGCRARHVAGPEDRRWVVRGGVAGAGGGRSAVDQDVIEDWISKGLLGSDDQVARPGGPWRALDLHEDFRGWFTPGDPRFKKRVAGDLARRRRRTVLRWRHLRLQGLRVLALAATLTIAWLAGQTGWTVVPEHRLAWLGSITGGAGERLASTVGRALSVEEAARMMRRREALPGSALLEDLASRRTSTGPASLHLVTGRALQLSSGGVPSDEAVAHLETAGLLAPLHVPTLAALAEAWALSGSDGATLDDARQILQRAISLGGEEVHVLRAQAALGLAAGSHEAALDMASRCLERNPASTNCLYYKGKALAAQERWKDAAAAYRVVHERVPFNEPFHLDLCLALLEAGELGEARRELARFHRLHGAGAGGLEATARLAWLLADWDDALAASRRAVELDPARWRSRLMAAELLLAKGAGAEAAATVEPPPGAAMPRDLAPRLLVVSSHGQRLAGAGSVAVERALAALELAPGWAPAALALGMSLVEQGDLGGAEAILQDADLSGLASRDAAAFLLHLGRIQQAQDRSMAAVETYGKALSRDTGSWTARVFLAMVYLDMENPVTAVDQIRATADMDLLQPSSHPPATLCPAPPAPLADVERSLRRALRDNGRLGYKGAGALGIVLFHQGRLGEAEGLFRRALKREPLDAPTLAYLAHALLALGGYQEAEAVLGELETLRGDDARVYALLGHARSLRGRHEEAAVMFQLALALAPFDPAPRRLMAQALRRAGDLEGAARRAGEAMDLDPLDHTSRRLLLMGDGDDG